MASSRSTTWDVLTSANAARATSWTVTAAVIAARAALWAVLGLVTGSRSTSWRVLTDTGGARDVLWLGFREHQRDVAFTERHRLRSHDERSRDVTFTRLQRIVTYAAQQRPVTYQGGTMELSRGGREFYDPGPTTTPALTVWEASFDGQASWKPAQLLDGRPKWLVAGPLAPTAPEGVDVAAVIATTTLPVLRAADDPELIVRDGPWIKLID